MSPAVAVGLPVEVEEPLVDVIEDGFTLHCCGPKTAPRALVASYQWNRSYVDLLTIQNFARGGHAAAADPDPRMAGRASCRVGGGRVSVGCPR